MDLVRARSSSLTPSLSERVSARCHRISSWIEATGVVSSGLAGFLSAFYFNSPALTGLSIIPLTGCALGYLYIRKYQKLAPINAITRDIHEDTTSIENTARRVADAAQIEIDIAHDLQGEDEKRNHQFAAMERGDELREGELDQMRQTIESLQVSNSGFATENERLKRQILDLNQTLSNLYRQLDRFQSQNQGFSNALQLMRSQRDHFAQDEKALSRANQDLSATISRLSPAVQDSHSAFHLISNEIDHQHETLGSMLKMVETFESDIKQKMAEKTRLEQEIEQARNTLENLQKEVLQAAEQRRSPLGRQQSFESQPNPQLQAHLNRIEGLADRFKDMLKDDQNQQESPK